MAKVMQLISSLAAVVAPVLLVTLLGYLWAKRGLAFDHNFVTNLVMLVGAPCLVFSTLTKSHLALAEVGHLAGAAICCLLLAAALSTVVLKLSGLSVRVYLPSLMFPNIGNMGLPVCLFAFGDTGPAITLMLLSLGVALAGLRAASLKRALALSTLRLGMGAAVGLAVSAAFGFEGASRGVVIIESAMPVAVFNYLFAVRYDNRPEEVAGMILVSTVMSYLTLPLLVAVLM